MRTTLYNALLSITQALLPVIAILSTKLKLFYKGRKNLLKNIKNTLSQSGASLLWVHCSSVGEFEQGLPVIEELKKHHNDWKVLVTFFSPSGYEAVNHALIDFKFYLPLDTAHNAREFVDSVDPKMAIFIKYEFWYNYLNELKKRDIPNFSVSSIFRPSQVFFKTGGGWNRKMLRAFTFFMVQDEQSLNLLGSINLTNASITGDTRFDRVLKIKEDPTTFPEIEAFCKEHKVFMVGSLRPEDDEVILNLVQSQLNLKFIIAPHEITEKHMHKIEEAIESTVRHSSLDETQMDKHVLIIDSIGKLSRLYRLADFTYIGGGFSDGIHNILEPAVYNLPVFFGNKYYLKYKEAVDLASLGGAFPIENTSQISNKLKELEDENVLNSTKIKIEDYVNSNKGAAQKVIKLIEQNIIQ